LKFPNGLAFAGHAAYYLDIGMRQLTGELFFPASRRHQKLIIDSQCTPKVLMKRNLLCAAIVLAAGSLIAADSKDDVNNAASKLAASDNYSWKTTTTMPGGGGGGGGGRFRPGPINGKTQKDGLTLVSFTMGDNTLDTVIQGAKGAIKTEDGWKSLEEAAQDDQGPARFMVRRLRTFKSPAADVQDLLSKTKEVTKSDDAYSGDLTTDGAKALLTFGGRRGGGGGGGGAPPVTNAKGSVKFWIKDGMITKYEIKVQGTITINDEDRDVNRTTTTEINEIGTTKVEPPDEAKKKLS
jgi:hypothetical protein